MKKYEIVRELFVVLEVDLPGLHKLSLEDLRVLHAAVVRKLCPGFEVRTDEWL